MSTHTLRPTTPISRTSTPAYHSSPGASTTETDSLEASWIPIDPVSPITSNSEGSDDDTLSSSTYSIGSDTANSLTSTESESESGITHNDEDVEGYIDAEASTIHSNSQVTPSEVQPLPLIFPHYDDLENSFASASDGTTPSASVQLQSTSFLSHSPAPVAGQARVQRSSSYRLSLDKGKGKGQSMMGDGQGDSLKMGILDGLNHAVAGEIGRVRKEEVEKEGMTAKEIREGVRNDRLKRVLAATNLANIRGGQKWSLKMSILTLASLLGLVLATVRYSIVPTSSPEVTTTNQVKPFSILDYLPSTSMEAPNTIMPDVRLLKNALSLSTKVSPPIVSNVQQQESKGRTGNYAVALRNSEAGLISFLQNSGSTWQRAKEMVRSSPPPPIITPSPVQSMGSGQIILSDLKNAWSKTKTISTYSHAEFIHYIRNQIIATIQLEIQQAVLLATYLFEVGKNVTRATTPYLCKGVNKTLGMYDKIKTFGGSINMPTTDLAASAAKAATNSVASKAAMTSQKGKEAIIKARAGLEYLVNEAKRRAGPLSTQEVKEEVQGGRFSGLRNKIRTHRGKAVQNPRTLSKVKVEDKMGRGKIMTIKERLMLALHNAAMPLVV